MGATHFSGTVWSAARPTMVFGSAGVHYSGPVVVGNGLMFGAGQSQPGTHFSGPVVSTGGFGWDFQGGISGWTATAATVAHARPVFGRGPRRGTLQITADGETNAIAIVENAVGRVGATAGVSYTVTAWFRTEDTLRNVRTAVNWIDAGGSTITGATGTEVTEVDGEWVQATLTAVAPAGTAGVRPRADIILGVGQGAGEIHFVDDVLVFPT